MDRKRDIYMCISFSLKTLTYLLSMANKRIRHSVYFALVYHSHSSFCLSPGSFILTRYVLEQAREKNRRLCDLTDGDTPRRRGHFSSGFSGSFLPRTKLRGWLAPSSRRAISRIMLARLLNVLMVAVVLMGNVLPRRNRRIRAPCD